MRVKRNENFGKLQAGYLFPEVSPRTRILVVSLGHEWMLEPRKMKQLHIGRLSKFQVNQNEREMHILSAEGLGANQQVSGCQSAHSLCLCRLPEGDERTRRSTQMQRSSA